MGCTLQVDTDRRLLLDIGRKGQCLSSTLLGEDIYVSTMEIDSASNDTPHKTSITLTDMDDEPLDADRMEIISQARSKAGFGKEIIQHLNKATRSSTNKAYNNSWRKFSTWCSQQKPPRDPEKYEIKTVIEFLMEHNTLIYSTLDGYRSAIASVYNLLHPLTTFSDG